MTNAHRYFLSQFDWMTIIAGYIHGRAWCEEHGQGRSPEGLFSHKPKNKCLAHDGLEMAQLSSTTDSYVFEL